MTKYEDLIKQIKNKDSSVNEIAKKYKMNVTDVKIIQEWKEKYEKEHKLRQEAETETILVKGIGMNSPEMKKAKERIAELDNSLSIALEINEEHQRYNGKLQTRLTELEEENKKLEDTLNNKLEDVRKAGL